MTIDLTPEVLQGAPYKAIMADPPWKMKSSTWVASPKWVKPDGSTLEHYKTVDTKDIAGMPVGDLADTPSILFLWVPHAMLLDGLYVMKVWGFVYKTQLIWNKTKQNGDETKGGTGYYFRMNTEPILFGIKGPPSEIRNELWPKNMPNLLCAPKSTHSKKPDSIYPIIESCSKGPYLELFARQKRAGWISFGNQLESVECQPKTEWKSPSFTSSPQSAHMSQSMGASVTTEQPG